MWVALGLWVGAHGASVWPRVRANNFATGWVAAVPTPVLIVSMRWVPADAGSLPDRSGSPAVAIPFRQRPWSERFTNEIKSRMYEPESTTRLDRWLFLRAAYRESAEVVTDPTGVRGDAYRYVVNAWLRQGRMSAEEERWARSVHQVRAEHPEYALDGFPTYARVQIRRLAEGGLWRVRLGEQLFEAKERKWPAGRDRFFDLRPVGLAVNGWWDGNVLVDRHMYTDSGWHDILQTTFLRTINGRIFEGDSYADVWWPVTAVSHDIKFKRAQQTPPWPGWPQVTEGSRIETITGFEVMDDDQAELALDWLARSIDVWFYTGGDMWHGRGMQVPDELVLFIGDGGRAPAKLPAFTFGGNASVMFKVRRGGGDPEEPRIDTVRAFECDPAWWALRDDMDSEGKRIFEHRWLRVKMKPTAPFQRRAGIIPGGSESLAQNDEVIGAWLEIRFGTELGGNEGFRALSDLQGTQFLTHTVRIPVGHGLFQNSPALRSESVRLPFDRSTLPGAGSAQN